MCLYIHSNGSNNNARQAVTAYPTVIFIIFIICNGFFKLDTEGVSTFLVLRAIKLVQDIILSTYNQYW